MLKNEKTPMKDAMLGHYEYTNNRLLLVFGRDQAVVGLQIPLSEHP